MSMFVQSEFRAFLNKSRQFTTQKLPFFSSFRLYFYIGKNTNRSISKKANIKIFVSQWILYQILVTLKVEPVLYSAQFFGTVHASRTVWHTIHLLWQIYEKFMFILIKIAVAVSVSWQQSYQIKSEKMMWPIICHL